MGIYIFLLLCIFAFMVFVLNVMESMLVCIQSISLSYNINYDGESVSQISELNIIQGQ